MVASKQLPENAPDLVRIDEEMCELALLIPGWQAEKLQQAACSQGISAGQYLRRLLNEALPSPGRLGSSYWSDFG